MDKVLLSSVKHDYGTPQDFYNKLNDIFKFEIDLAADCNNSKCRKFINSNMNSLLYTWDYKGWSWLNPPYGRSIIKWVQKAYESSGKICMLIPSRTDTKWQHDYVFNSDCILFIKGRLKFLGVKESAPFPSQLVFFGQVSKHELEQLEKLNLGKLFKK